MVAINNKQEEMIMGYCTDYDITNNSEEVQEAIREKSGYDYFSDITWYDHSSDCKEVSLMFPEVVIELSGEGEEAGDIWKKYFQDGKMQVCEAVITFAPFDPKLLK